MVSDWLFALGFLPVMAFWIILKITRFRLYAYRRQKYPVEHGKLGYHAMDAIYLRDIFTNPHKDDRVYSHWVSVNRKVFMMFMVLFILTLWMVYQYLN